MIEERIQILRRAAQISSSDKEEKVWCVIAGNDRLVDDIAYNAITAKDRVQILFRETVSISSKHSYKKFDCILLKGETLKIRELNNKSREEGGASLQITSTSLKNQPNLLVVVGPEDSMKKFVSETNKHNAKTDILLEDHTTGFIKSEPKIGYVPSFLKSLVTPILDTSEIILSTLLISVKEEDDIEKVKSISQNNALFGIDLKKTIQDKEIAKLIAEEKKEADKKAKENKEADKTESSKEEKKETNKEDKKEADKEESAEERKKETDEKSE